MIQQHLTYKEMTDFGCFYTPQRFVNIVHDMIYRNIKNTEEYVLIDTACGYGTFLNKCNNKFRSLKCNDIDLEAVQIAKSKNNINIKYYNKNALYKVSRAMFDIDENEKLIIIGNPPYNDTTSIVKNTLKKPEPCEIDEDIKTRDLGISFLLSYNKLCADYIAILHPLSYLIKYANYKLLNAFYSNYSIVDSVIVNSQDFTMTSKSMGFPIVIILYKRASGIIYQDIKNRIWKTVDDKKFILKRDVISNYISKYPQKNAKLNDKSILFYTMRDINALKRNKTFIEEYSSNAIIVDVEKFHFYCYVDIFKEYADQIPYFWGNYEVFIDFDEFNMIKEEFVHACLMKYPFLQNKININFRAADRSKIDLYFKKLLRDIYVY
ncbi:MAG: rRNA adenine N-6-methyltransferase family protein [Christensenellales bacterium]|jgi:hypothetical protein